jgi:hypothetical protein
MGHKDLAPDYFALSVEKQQEIEKEIDAKSLEITNDLIAELKKRGYIVKEPNDAVLRKLIQTVMKRHGVGK